MYGKFFASTFTGSMFGAGPDVFAVWGYVIATAVDSSVELNPALVAAIIGTAEDRVAEAIEKLCAPDPNSRNEEHEGRRLIKDGRFQYRVVSHAKYRGIRNEEDRRESNRLAQRRHREKVAATKASSDDMLTAADGTDIADGQPMQSQKQSQIQKEKPRAPSAPVVGEALRFPETSTTANFNRRDLERAVSSERGTEWRTPTARFHVQQADETAAQIMAEASKRAGDPHELARRAFRGWLESQKSVDPMVWCANWAAALPPAPKPQRERAIL